MANLIQNFSGPTPPGWRVVRNVCLFAVGLLAVIINAGGNMPSLGFTDKAMDILNLISGVISFVALYAQGQGNNETSNT